MSITLYRCARYGKEGILKEEFERVTERFAIRLDGRRESLRTNYDNWFTTEQDAISHRRSQLERDVRNAARTLEGCESKLRAFNNRFPETPSSSATPNDGERR